MKMKVTDVGIKIYTENAQDKVYIENFLNLKNEGEYILCRRENAMGLSCSIVCLKISPKKESL